MAVNITNVTNMNTLADTGQFVSDATGGIFWGIVLISLFIVLVFNMLKQGVAKATASASFSCLTISFPLFFLGWINMVFMIVFGVGLAASLAFLWFEDHKAR